MNSTQAPTRGFPFKKVMVGTIGTAMEWYDFGVYGFFAAIIGSQFFPAKDQISSLVAAFGAFAAGFLARAIPNRYCAVGFCCHTHLSSK